MRSPAKTLHRIFCLCTKTGWIRNCTKVIGLNVYQEHQGEIATLDMTRGLVKVNTNTTGRYTLTFALPSVQLSLQSYLEKQRIWPAPWIPIVYRLLMMTQDDEVVCLPS
jgi:hypothetical protein